jgi:hypothetical protein
MSFHFSANLFPKCILCMRAFSPNTPFIHFRLFFVCFMLINFVFICVVDHLTDFLSHAESLADSIYYFQESVPVHRTQFLDTVCQFSPSLRIARNFSTPCCRSSVSVHRTEFFDVALLVIRICASHGVLLRSISAIPSLCIARGSYF